MPLDSTTQAQGSFNSWLINQREKKYQLLLSFKDYYGIKQEWTLMELAEFKFHFHHLPVWSEIYYLNSLGLSFLLGQRE